MTANLPQRVQGEGTPVPPAALQPGPRAGDGHSPERRLGTEQTPSWLLSPTSQASALHVAAVPGTKGRVCPSDPSRAFRVTSTQRHSSWLQSHGRWLLIED